MHGAVFTVDGGRLMVSVVYLSQDPRADQDRLPVSTMESRCQRRATRTAYSSSSAASNASYAGFRLVLAAATCERTYLGSVSQSAARRPDFMSGMEAADGVQSPLSGPLGFTQSGESLALAKS